MLNSFSPMESPIDKLVILCVPLAGVKILMELVPKFVALTYWFMNLTLSFLATSHNPTIFYHLGEPRAHLIAIPSKTETKDLTLLCSMNASQSDFAVGKSPMEWHLYRANATSDKFPRR